MVQIIANDVENIKIFISGPMTGYEKYNFPEFDRLEYRLKEIGGYDVINPAKIARKFKVKEVLEHKEIFQKMIDEELDALKTCSHILLLRGWEKSFGALKELQTAIECNLTIVLEENSDRDLHMLERYQERQNIKKDRTYYDIETGRKDC